MNGRLHHSNNRQPMWLCQKLGDHNGCYICNPPFNGKTTWKDYSFTYGMVDPKTMQSYQLVLSDVRLESHRLSLFKLVFVRVLPYGPLSLIFAWTLLPEVFKHSNYGHCCMPLVLFLSKNPVKIFDISRSHGKLGWTKTDSI